MRWLSSFAILVYLSLLCSPSVWEVHDARIAPLADSQLLLLAPSVKYYSKLAGTEQDTVAFDIAPASVSLTHFRRLFSLSAVNYSGKNASAFYSPQLARAPPHISSH